MEHCRGTFKAGAAQNDDCGAEIIVPEI